MQIKDFLVKRNGRFINRWMCSFYLDEKYIVGYGFTGRTAIRDAAYDISLTLQDLYKKSRNEPFTLSQSQKSDYDV